MNRHTSPDPLTSFLQRLVSAMNGNVQCIGERGVCWPFSQSVSCDDCGCGFESMHGVGRGKICPCIAEVLLETGDAFKRLPEPAPSQVKGLARAGSPKDDQHGPLTVRTGPSWNAVRRREVAAPESLPTGPTQACPLGVACCRTQGHFDRRTCQAASVLLSPSEQRHVFRAAVQLDLFPVQKEQCV